MTAAQPNILARVIARRLVTLSPADGGGGGFFRQTPVTPPKSRLNRGLEWFTKRLNLPRERFDELAERERKHAFTVAGVAQLDLIQQVKEALASAVAEGKTLEEFKDEVGASLEAEWKGTVANPGARLETIFRTNVQSAYNAGKHHAATEPDALERRPYWQFVAALDNRTTNICRPLNGKVIKADDPFWNDHTPPLHFNCRSTIRPLTEEQAKQRGIATGDEIPARVSAEGFGRPPGQPTDLLAGRDPSLAGIVRQKIEANQ